MRRRARSVPHVGEQGSWGATRDEKIVMRRGGAWIILKLGRYSVARRGGAARNKFRGWRMSLMGEKTKPPRA